MNAYIYQAALLCEECAHNVMSRLAAVIGPDAGSQFPGDSDVYPQGPYPNGGGEADNPQNCDYCNVFLENSLTMDGMECVRGCVSMWAAVPADKRALGPATALTVWAPFYGVELP